MLNKKPLLQTQKRYFHIIYSCRFGTHYEVVEEGKRFFAIYISEWGEKRFITHRTNQKNACRVAKLLQEAYIRGKEWGSRYGI